MKNLTINNKIVSLDSLVKMIKSKLELVLDNHPSQYITIKIEEETETDFLSEIVKIRVSNHSGRKQNNDVKTLSFITDRCAQGYDSISDEYLVQSIEEMITDTFEYVLDILEYELLENTKLS